VKRAVATVTSAISIIMTAAAAAPGQPVPNGAAAVSHEYAEVNGVRLHYAKAGKGPVVVFLHGFPEFWYEWKYQIAEFSKDHTVVAPDMRGYNLSAKPADLAAYQVPVLVEDIRALAARLLKDAGAAKFTLVAHDWGGAIAWVFAAMHPEMLERLVIVNAPHPTVFGRLLREDAAQQRASQYMLMFRGPEAEQTLAANNYQLLTTMVLGASLKDGTLTEDDRREYVSAWSQPGALTGGLNYYRAAQIGPTAPADAKLVAPPSNEASLTSMPPLIIRVPTLVIWGEKDTALLTSNLDGLDQLVPTLTVKRVADGTHWVVRENAPEVNRLIREFLTQPH
jgi:pimeloyl-ACP methyl ester carboxylesterase